MRRRLMEREERRGERRVAVIRRRFRRRRKHIRFSCSSKVCRFFVVKNMPKLKIKVTNI